MSEPGAERASDDRPRRTVTVAGGGNFGTVIANIVAGRGHEVLLWMRDAEQVEETGRLRENRRYLPGHRLHDNVSPVGDLSACASRSDMVFVSVPSASFREVATEIGLHLRAGTIVVSTTKGIEADGFRLMSDVLREACPQGRIGVLSGPNIAEEIARGDYTGTVIASPDAALRTEVQETVHSRSFRVYSNPDMYGVELGGALKNIYAIASGMAAALGAGQNTLAMLITRGLGEMSRFATSQGANPLTFLGLAGVGDLMVTCSSPLSRNYQLGHAIGSGRSLADAQAALGKLAEGVNTIGVVWARAREFGVDMPILQGLHEILFEERHLAEVLVRLMLGEQRDDVEFVAAPA
ncbi:MAG: NAD(P)H-dependent glycerol-3-phosphate dehydrogenase [Pseudomonadales bacterium]|jgi:glycerol-3-phosphate dehydrogenase (NAD(P)+)|nr:NAD(P)H-dependent glycerol-3-phosphate dehydrogenase [Pseudomonadales bacterium]